MQGDKQQEPRPWKPKERSGYDEAIRRIVKELTTFRFGKQILLAKAAGLHQTAVSKFVSAPSEQRLYADDIARALGVTTEWLLDAERPYKLGDPIPASAQVAPDIEAESADIWARINNIESVILRQQADINNLQQEIKEFLAAQSKGALAPIIDGMIDRLEQMK